MLNQTIGKIQVVFHWTAKWMYQSFLKTLPCRFQPMLRVWFLYSRLILEDRSHVNFTFMIFFWWVGQQGDQDVGSSWPVCPKTTSKLFLQSHQLVSCTECFVSPMTSDLILAKSGPSMSLRSYRKLQARINSTKTIQADIEEVAVKNKYCK